MPAIFVGHGNPMNAIEHNSYTAEWQQLADSLPRPRAILAISAHWYLPGGRVTAGDRPATIHDFGGFPKELFEVGYPAPGSSELADCVADLLAPAVIEPDTRWGLDHGTWSILVHMYPDADIPVVQLGIDETLTAAQHYDLGRRLRPLREDGVLILGSGNVVHNLDVYAWDRRPIPPYQWAVRFNSWLRQAIMARRFGDVIDYRQGGADAELAVPTPEHYLPLLYTLATHTEDEPVSLPVDGFDGGSISMLGVRIG
ncbi:4,5-DOPA dioxygenase extradiol [Mycobacterium helveticum]|uniref:4,5-DOPA dioxygenase extradiol n=2 Tax=Mycobacterium helveticum TaxID=2592811 RepID=A0A557WWW6_9MYCO|nr:4,5-DOPA dioxygenase extradiol [Mycobacterium helveticum]TVS77755.1 4,5-DOPA dioxygenase extradiol [Mycobacterium helveticum]